MGRIPWMRALLVASTSAACVGYVLHLSSTEQDAVVFPSTVNFPAIEVGQSSMRTITISPAAGSQSDTVMTISEPAAGCPDFTISTPGLPAVVSSVCTGSGSGSGSGSTCTQFNTVSYTFTATFTPSFAGTQNCKLDVTISNVVNTITLVGTGTPPPIDMQVETGTKAADTTRCASCAIDFGQANVGADAPPEFVKVVNEGSGMGTIKTVTIGGTNAGAFAIQTGQVSNRGLASKEFETYGITCHPSADGVTESATLIIDTDDPKGPRAVDLSCTGIQSNLEYVDPNSNTVIGTIGLATRVQQSVNQAVTLRNKGGALLTVSGVAFHGHTPADPPPSGLSTNVQVGDQIAANGGTRGITVSFLPTVAVDSQPPIARLEIKFENDAESRELLIMGPAVETTLSMTPAAPGTTANLGTICVGQPSVTPFTILASGRGDFEVQQLAVAGGGYTVVPHVPATLPSAAQPAPVKAGGDSKVEFDIAITPQAAGPILGTLTLHTDIPTQPIQEPTILSATALQSGASLDPAAPMEFGTVDVGGQSTEPSVISLTNCDAAELAITRVEIVGDQDFQIVGSVPTSVAPNSSVAFPIVLAPHTGGTKLATFTVEYATGTGQVPLIGNGNGPLEEVAGRDTYYACNSGGSTGGGVIVFAVLFVVRRRRIAATVNRPS